MSDLSSCWRGVMSISDIGVYDTNVIRVTNPLVSASEPTSCGPLPIPSTGVRCLRSVTGIDDRGLVGTQAPQSWVVTCFSEETKWSCCATYVALMGVNSTPKWRLTTFFRSAYTRQDQRLGLVGARTFSCTVQTLNDENQKDVINRRNGQGPKHLKFFLLVFAKDETQAQSPSPRRPSPWKPTPWRARPSIK